MDFEVLSPGTYHNFPAFTVESLDEIVANFDALKSYLRPPLKAGHSGAQILRGQNDGDPALGWCVALKRQGDKLIGTFAGIPEKFAALIKKGRYLRGSSEIHMAWEKSQDEANLKTGRTGRVFQGFAVLGAELPAVKNLGDLAEFLGSAPLQLSAAPTPAVAHIECALSEDDPPADAVPDTETPTENDGRHSENESIPTAPAVEETTMHDPIKDAPKDDASTVQLADLVAQFAALKADREADKAAHAAALAERDAKIAKLSEDTAQARAREAAADTKARKLDAAAWVASFSQAGNLRILPAQRSLAQVLRERLTALDATIAPTELVGCFSADETPTELTLADVFERMVKAMPDQKVLLTEVTGHTDTTIDGLENYIQLTAKTQGKNPKDPVVRRELTLLCATERPELLAQAS